MIPHDTIEIFGSLWWQSNIITLSIIFFLLVVGRLIHFNGREKLAKIIGIILIFRSVGVHFFWDHLGIWTIESSLPLHLCGLSAILSGVVLFWRNQLAYECLYYWGIIGAFHSLLTPEFTMGNEGLLFYEYYLSHGGIILSALYLTWVLGMKPREGSWLKIFIFSQILIPSIGLVNMLINANYMYLCDKPIVNNPFLIGDWPWYIIGVEFAAILHFIIAYAPFGFYYRKNKINGSVTTI